MNYNLDQMIGEKSAGYILFLIEPVVHNPPGARPRDRCKSDRCFGKMMHRFES